MSLHVCNPIQTDSILRTKFQPAAGVGVAVLMGCVTVGEEVLARVVVLLLPGVAVEREDMTLTVMTGDILT